MNEIKKDEKNIIKRRISIDIIPANYLESITFLDSIDYDIRKHKNRLFYIPITTEVLNRYDLTGHIFIKFPFSPEYFYKEEYSMFKDDNIINVFVELLFDNNKTTLTTKEKIKNLAGNKSIDNDIIGYIELKFYSRKPKEYRFPKPLSFKVMLNNRIEKGKS